MRNLKEQKGEKSSSKGWQQPCTGDSAGGFYWVRVALPRSKTCSALGTTQCPRRGRASQSTLCSCSSHGSIRARKAQNLACRGEATLYFPAWPCAPLPAELPCANPEPPDPPTAPAPHAHSSICRTSRSARIFHSSGAKCGPDGKWKQSRKGHPEQPFFFFSSSSSQHRRNSSFFFFLCATSLSLKAQDGFAGENI